MGLLRHSECDIGKSRPEKRIIYFCQMFPFYLRLANDFYRVGGESFLGEQALLHFFHQRSQICLDCLILYLHGVGLTYLDLAAGLRFKNMYY